MRRRNAFLAACVVALALAEPAGAEPIVRGLIVINGLIQFNGIEINRLVPRPPVESRVNPMKKLPPSALRLEPIKEGTVIRRFANDFRLPETADPGGAYAAKVYAPR
jgi:hypothetical protein